MTDTTLTAIDPDFIVEDDMLFLCGEAVRLSRMSKTHRATLAFQAQHGGLACVDDLRRNNISHARKISPLASSMNLSFIASLHDNAKQWGIVDRVSFIDTYFTARQLVNIKKVNLHGQNTSVMILNDTVLKERMRLAIPAIVKARENYVAPTVTRDSINRLKEAHASGKRAYFGSLRIPTHDL